MEKVDVLLAVYKSNITYLKKQIDSILNQTHTNLKLIISDDHSEEPEIQKVLKEYEQRDNRVIVYYQSENIGYTKNFGFLLEKSNAKYICFSDHDDIWYPNKIEKSLEKLKKDNVDMVYTNSKQIDENDNVIQENYLRYKNVPIVNGKSKFAISRCIGIGCSQMFTKSIRDKAIPFKESVIAHDWLIAFLANENKGIFCIEEPLFDYRLHNTNVFGGRNLAQNLHRWKEKHGNSYKSYLKYREEKVIDMAYLDCSRMCLDYSINLETTRILNKLIKYYEKLKKSKFINLHFITYFRYLIGKNVGVKFIKEIVIFHFPVLGYLWFKNS